MRSTSTFQRIALALLAGACLAAAPAPAQARPLQTGLTNPTESAFAEADPAGAYAAARAAGVSVIRVPVVWGNHTNGAPRDATDPADRAYMFGEVDAKVRAIVDAGMEPLVMVHGTPNFARARGLSPNPGDLGAFMTAIARRYGGGFAGLPRVRLFQVWNEPNLKSYLDPPGAAAHYRAMLQAAYPAVHGVHDDNVLVAGGLGPFAGPNGRYGVPPLRFMRAVLARPVRFDVWAHHPYTSGHPARRAANRGDASIGDLPAIRAVLRANGHRRARLWVTEFSWDSAPPDPFAVPLREHARWVSEGLFRMWRAGVSLVVWFQLRDNPRGTFTWGQTFQSGLYFRTAARYADERAKPAGAALRFPFVALPARGGATLWGRTPHGRGATVLVERRVRGGWRRVVRLRADRDGIFQRRARGLGGATLRARVGSTASPGFVVRRTKKRFVNPFGGSSLPPNA